MKKENFILYTLACVNFTHIMDSMIMMPLGGTFMEAFNIGPKQFTLLVSSYAIGAFLSNLAGIFLLDFFDRKRALIFIYGGFVAGTMLCALSNSYESLLAVRFVTGLFGGLNGALIFAIASDVFPYSHRGRAMGALMAGFSAAAALGVPFGLLVSLKFSWHFAFVFIALFGVGVLAAVVLGFPPLTGHLKEKPAGRRSIAPMQTLRLIWRDANQVNALLFGVILVFGHMIIIPFVAPYMERNVGFTMQELIYMYLIGGAMTVFSSPIFGRITDRFGGKRVYAVLLFLSFIPTLWVTHLNSQSLALGLVASALFFVFGSGRMIAPQAMISAVVNSQTRGSFMSFKAALQQLAIGLASILSGFIVVETEAGTFAHYNVVGYLSVAVLLITLIYPGRLRVADGN